MKTAIPVITKYTFQLSLRNEILKKLSDTGLFVRNSNVSINERHRKRIQDKSVLLGKISGQKNKYTAHYLRIKHWAVGKDMLHTVPHLKFLWLSFILWKLLQIHFYSKWNVSTYTQAQWWLRQEYGMYHKFHLLTNSKELL